MKHGIFTITVCTVLLALTACTDRVLASPQERPTDWLLIGYAMAVVENGKALPAVPMLKGFSLATSQ